MKQRRSHLQRLRGTSTQSLSASDSQRTLSVLDFGYVYDNARLERFERRHNAIVEVETIANSAQAINRLKTEPTPDLAALGNYAVPQAIGEGLLKPVAVNRITGYQSVFDRLKRDSESFDELLRRLAADEQPIEIGAWDSETADRAREAIDRSRESFER